MASLHMSSRFCAALLLLIVGCTWVHGQTCPEGGACVQEDYGIGTAFAEPSEPTGRRMLFQTPRFVSAVKQNEVPHLANRRSLLQSSCSETDNSADAVIQCTNAVRSSPAAFAGDYRCGSAWTNSYQSLGPLDKNSALMTAAQRHAEDNARTGQLTHTGSDGSRVSDRVGRAGYEYSSVRENIAFGYLSAKSVVMGWMCSDGHRKNIMSCDIKDIGVGLAQGSNGRWYHAQDFGCPRGGSCSCSGGTGSPSGATGSTAPEQPTSSPGTSGIPSSPSSEQPSNTPGGDSSSQYQPQYGGDGSGYGDYQQYYQQYQNQQGQQGDSSGSYDPFSGSQGSGFQGSGGFFNTPGSQHYESEDGAVTVRRGGGDGSRYTFVSARSGGAGDNSGSFFGGKK